MDRREAIKKTMLLTGYALSAPTLHALLSSCEPEREVNWTPKFFDASQAATLTHMAETLLPRTRTPGAIDTGVPAFMDLIIKDTFEPEDKEKFLAGLADMDTRALKAFGKVFAACKPKQQHQLMEQIDAEASADGKAHKEAVEAGRVSRDEPYFNFFLTFKWLALYGYFTSEFVGTKVLNYDPIPGVYNGCIPLSETGNRNWSL